MCHETCEDLISCMCIHDIQNEGWRLDMTKKFNPDEVIGKPYQRGMLPYGGSVTKGKISSAIGEDEYRAMMKRLKAILA